jgi:hypothetical protein
VRILTAYLSTDRHIAKHFSTTRACGKYSERDNPERRANSHRNDTRGKWQFVVAMGDCVSCGAAESLATVTLECNAEASVGERQREVLVWRAIQA